MVSDYRRNQAWVAGKKAAEQGKPAGRTIGRKEPSITTIGLMDGSTSSSRRLQSPTPMTETYRGLTCRNEYPPIPIREWDWIASDPDGEGRVLANGATLDELKADIDRYLMERDDE